MFLSFDVQDDSGKIRVTAFDAPAQELLNCSTYDIQHMQLNTNNTNNEKEYNDLFSRIMFSQRMFVCIKLSNITNHTALQHLTYKLNCIIIICSMLGTTYKRRHSPTESNYTRWQ